MIAAAIGTSVESLATAAVETSTSSAGVTAAMLGKSGRRSNSEEEERCDSCEKSFQQGGMLHFSSLHPKPRFRAREGEPQPQILLYLDSHSKFRVVQVVQLNGNQFWG